ncbi:MAG TPA: hypothetical protein ENI85_05230, partial [Deltaproteobacteria bacterium]|nr:hypothetical protein [Deltaproteobacteria bacterium]
MSAGGSSLRTLGISVIVAGLGLSMGFAAGGALRPSPARQSSAAPTPSAAEMESAVDSALHEPDLLERTTRLNELFGRLDAENVSGAVSAFDRLLIAADPCSVRGLLHAWSGFDGDAARSHVLTWKIPGKRTMGILETSAASAYFG